MKTQKSMAVPPVIMLDIGLILNGLVRVIQTQQMALTLRLMLALVSLVGCNVPGILMVPLAIWVVVAEVMASGPIPYLPIPNFGSTIVLTLSTLSISWVI